ncbi:MAG: acyltransferase [Proteobacteria bacterium]|nr:MAG: acyltransferase [Pseudomonadota bacterium]
MKRLFPALFVMVAVTNLTFTLLRPPSFSDVVRTGASSLIGVSNIFLFHKSTDYFSLDARLNPFTHTWSLGIEEQFYLFFPLFLVLIGMVAITGLELKRRKSIIYLMMFFSFLSYLISHFSSKDAAFYLLPNRMWELGAGCAVFVISQKGSTVFERTVPATFLAVLALFFAPPAFQIASTFGSVLATSLLINGIRPKSSVYRFLSSKVAIYVGSRSYSIYLWHWPILVASKWLVGDSTQIKVLCLAFTFLLGELSYRFEFFIRYSKKLKDNIVTLIGSLSCAALFFIIFGFYLPTHSNAIGVFAPNLLGIQKVEEWPDNDCHGAVALKKLADPMVHCLLPKRSQQKPHVVFLIGDSHAAQLFEMIADSIQDSDYSLRFINTEDDNDFPQSWIHQLNPPLPKTIDFILDHFEEDDYIIMSFHRGHLNEVRDQHVPLSELSVANQKASNFFTNAAPFVEQLNALKINLVLVKDTPLMSSVTQSQACALQTKITGTNRCQVTRKQDLKTRFQQDYVFDSIQKKFPNVFVFDPQSKIFGSNETLDVVDNKGRYVMWDWNHITASESKRLAADFKTFLVEKAGFKKSFNDPHSKQKKSHL